MAYSKANYEDVEPKAPGMYFLRDALDCEQLGLTVVEGDERWEGLEHDHAEDDHEEVYLVLDGAVTVHVEGESVSLGSGDAVRVDPSATRTVDFDEESKLVIAGAP